LLWKRPANDAKPTNDEPDAEGGRFDPAEEKG
jgi:hypothetical protein